MKFGIKSGLLRGVFLAALANPDVALAQVGDAPAPQTQSTVEAQLETFFSEIGHECIPKFRQYLKDKKKKATPKEIAQVLNAPPLNIGTRYATQYTSAPNYFGLIYEKNDTSGKLTGKSIDTIFGNREVILVEDNLTPFGTREYDCAAMMKVASDVNFEFGIAELKTAIETTTSSNTLAFIQIGTIISPFDAILNRTANENQDLDAPIRRRETWLKLWNWYDLPQNRDLVAKADGKQLYVATAFSGYAASKLTNIDSKLLLEAAGKLSIPLGPIQNSSEAERKFQSDAIAKSSIPRAGVIKSTRTGHLPGPDALKIYIENEMKGKMAWSNPPAPIDAATSRTEIVSLPGIPKELCRDDKWQLSKNVTADNSAATITSRIMDGANRTCETKITITPASTGAEGGQMSVPFALIWTKHDGTAGDLTLNQNLEIPDYRAPATIEPTISSVVTGDGQMDATVRELPGWQISGGTQPNLKMECRTGQEQPKVVSVGPNDIVIAPIQQGQSGNKYFGLKFSQPLVTRMKDGSTCKIRGGINFTASHLGAPSKSVVLDVPETEFEVKIATQKAGAT